MRKSNLGEKVLGNFTAWDVQLTMIEVGNSIKRRRPLAGRNGNLGGVSALQMKIPS